MTEDKERRLKNSLSSPNGNYEAIDKAMLKFSVPLDGLELKNQKKIKEQKILNLLITNLTS